MHPNEVKLVQVRDGQTEPTKEFEQLAQQFPFSSEQSYALRTQAVRQEQELALKK